MPNDRSLADIIADLTWEQIVEDGVVTSEEIDAAIVGAGEDPRKYDHLYD